MMSQMPGAIDNKMLKLSDLDLEFVATKAGGTKKPGNRNPERALIRHNMIEVFIRVSMTKFLKSKIIYK
jgi:hypothetical protein